LLNTDLIFCDFPKVYGAKMHSFTIEGTHAPLASKLSYKVTSSLLLFENNCLNCCTRVKVKWKNIRYRICDELNLRLTCWPCSVCILQLYPWARWWLVYRYYGTKTKKKKSASEPQMMQEHRYINPTVIQSKSKESVQ